MDPLIVVYVEIPQFSNIKYEYNKDTNRLEIDRVLNPPFVYPYAYGFIPHTLAKDGDELDILILTSKPLQNDKYYQVHLIGALDMEDEKGTDEKILCVLPEDYEKIKDIDDVSDEIKNEISYFFSNYKNNVKDKWSTVGSFMNRRETMELFINSLH